MSDNEPFSQEELNEIFKISPTDPERVISRESSSLEFKESFGWMSLPNYLKTSVAYANTKGGYIVFGITEVCQQIGLPNPIIVDCSGGITVKLVNNTVKTPVETKVKTLVETRVTRHDEVSGKRRESVGKTSGKILDACRESPSITIPEMAEKIGVTERSVQRNIQKLQADSFLRRVGGRKEGYWEVIESDEG